MKIRVSINIKVGHIVKYFVLSDLFFLAGWGLVQPIFSVFVIEKVAGATLITVGVAAAIYWILKSVLEIPIANHLDRIGGEKNSFVTLVCGLFLAAFSAFAFTWVREIWELYAVQAIYAIAFSFYVPSWYAIFSRHLDRGRVSFDWTLDSTMGGMGAGVTGLLSGILANIFGFSTVFIIAGILSVIAAFIIMASPEIVLPKTTDGDGEADVKEHSLHEAGV